VQEEITIKRDCPAVLIPAGTAITLQAGVPVVIAQALGGSFTVIVHGNMARVAGADADALGMEAPAATAAAEPGQLTEAQVYEVLRSCYDPEIPVNIVELGLVYDLQILPLPEGGHRVEIKMTLTAPGCGMGPILQQDVESRVLALPGVKEAGVFLVWDPPWNREMLSEAAKLQLGMM
jgi:probable FeS assembly SUF system protein SufT